MMIPSKYAWRVVVSMRISKDSSRFFTVEAVALQNLPQTLRGRERSKRGYATPLLSTALAGQTRRGGERSRHHLHNLRGQRATLLILPRRTQAFVPQ
jgi:hypothetical protein